MKKLSLLAFMASVALVATPAFAMGGCTNSPENPTLVLAGLAGGVCGVRSLRTYLRARKGR
jgi:XrtJ-associated TM-motif-TM protein